MDIKKYNNKIVAKDKNDNTSYFVRVFKDNSAALMYNNGCCNGVWCSISSLKTHLKYLSYITRKNFLDNNFDILDVNFFKELEII